MSAYHAAPFVLFPALGLVALSIGLLSRRYSAAALAIGLAGLLALTVASTWLITAPPLTVTAPLPESLAPKNKTEPLKDTPPALAPVVSTSPSPVSPDVAQLQTNLEKAQSELERLRSERRAEQALREEAERKREVAERVSADASLQARVAEEKIVDLRTKLGDAQAARVSAEHRLALAQQKAGSPQPPPAPSQPSPSPTLLNAADIRQRLVSGGGRHWTAQKLDRELISGWNGEWYLVRLLRNGEAWSFRDREFALADASKDIAASAAQLRDELLLPLSKTPTRWHLYVRGTADARQVVGPAGREVAYLPLQPDGTYAPQSEARARIPVRIQNDRLPQLRADWLRQVVHPVIGAVGAKDIAILENPPGPDQGRTAELVLYVERASPPR